MFPFKSILALPVASSLFTDAVAVEVGHVVHLQRFGVLNAIMKPQTP